MATMCLVIGESGSGKSSSVRTLNPKSTFVLSVLNKPLPFKDWRSKYTLYSKENPAGNYFVSENYEVITALIKKIADRKEIETLVIDDVQYLMANEFMRKHGTQGKGNQVFQLFNDIGDHFWNLIMDLQLCRENLVVFMLSHSETTDAGISKCKTIGKMLDDKITVEGLFPIVLQCRAIAGEYKFITQNNGSNTAKSPMGMLETEISNDLDLVVKAIKQYNL